MILSFPRRYSVKTFELSGKLFDSAEPERGFILQRVDCLIYSFLRVTEEALHNNLQLCQPGLLHTFFLTDRQSDLHRPAFKSSTPFFYAFK